MQQLTMIGAPVDPMFQQRMQQHIQQHLQYLMQQNPQLARQIMGAVGEVDPGNAEAPIPNEQAPGNDQAPSPNDQAPMMA
jgi:hypothetical protein